jgi:hypothetical protein
VKDPGYELRDAIYTALNENLTYTLNSTQTPIDVYSFVAHNVDYPYVIIHPFTQDNPDYTKGDADDIHECVVPIEVITGLEEDAQCYETVNEVMDQIIDLLVKKLLIMTNYTMHMAIQQSLQEFREMTDTHEILRKYLTMKYIVERK